MCLCTGLITRYCVCVFLVVYDLETSRPELGCCATGGKKCVILLLISSLATYVVEDGAIPVENDC
jgi:hypothetical protein